MWCILSVSPRCWALMEQQRLYYKLQPKSVQANWRKSWPNHRVVPDPWTASLLQGSAQHIFPKVHIITYLCCRFTSHLGFWNGLSAIASLFHRLNWNFQIMCLLNFWIDRFSLTFQNVSLYDQTTAPIVICETGTHHNINISMRLPLRNFIFCNFSSYCCCLSQLINSLRNPNVVKFQCLIGTKHYKGK